MYKIRHKYTECIYKQFDRGDFATFEMFVVDSGKSALVLFYHVIACVWYEGPVDLATSLAFHYLHLIAFVTLMY